MSDCRFGVSPFNYPDPENQQNRFDEKVKRLQKKEKGKETRKISKSLICFLFHAHDLNLNAS